MTHKTLVIDLDRCIGCYACEVACKNENSIPLGVHYNKVLTIGPLGKFPDIQQYFLPSVCQNCREAPCVKVCPPGAAYQRQEDGQVLVHAASMRRPRWSRSARFATICRRWARSPLA